MRELMKMGWEGPSICVLCATDTETIDHIFLQCPFTIYIWDRVALYLKLHLP